MNMANVTKVTDLTFDELIGQSGLKLEYIAAKLDMTSNNLWKIRQNPKRLNVNLIDKLTEILDVEDGVVYHSIMNSPNVDEV